MAQLNVRVDDGDAKWFKIQCIVHAIVAGDMFRLMRAAIEEVGVSQAAKLRLADNGLAHAAHAMISAAEAGAAKLRLAEKGLAYGPGSPVSVGRPPGDETAEG